MVLSAFDSRGCSQFVLAMGDNFYDVGIVGDVTCTRFQTTFEDVYTYESLQTPWLVLAGYAVNVNVYPHARPHICRGVDLF